LIENIRQNDAAVDQSTNMADQLYGCYARWPSHSPAHLTNANSSKFCRHLHMTSLGKL